MRVANVAAGLVVAKVGTATATQEELLGALEGGHELDADTRVVAIEEAVHRARLWHRLGLRVGLVQFSFDRLDAAAIAFLQNSRSQCDRLIVAATAGSEVLASIVYVDLVITGSHTADTLLKELRPDYSVV
jgi:D-beta-D-heptose 7-phosphate kinase/D-beta-D-heptose 1-phosphate adenosyltransferase